MNRRQFLLLATAGSFGAALGVSELMKFAAQPAPVSATPTPTWLYSASDNPAGGHFLSKLNLSSGTVQSLPVGVRGHGVLPMSDGRVVMFGRRPAFACEVVNFDDASNLTLNAINGRHFAGHGCLSGRGDVLFTTENDYNGKRGVLGIRDSKSLQPVEEYTTYGLDPHDVQLLPDGKTLVVANGGIETHPDFGRRKLNLDTMQPSLVYLDSETGKKLDEYRLPDHQLSIRHLIVTPDGDIGVALQYEGDLYRKQPASLVAWQHAGGDLRLLTVDNPTVAQFNGYMADLAYDPQQRIAAVTSPRGNHVTFWDTDAGAFLAAIPLTEPSGLAFIPAQGFVVSGANGDLHRCQVTKHSTNATLLHKFTDTLWDNHLTIA